MSKHFSQIITMWYNTHLDFMTVNIFNESLCLPDCQVSSWFIPIWNIIEMKKDWDASPLHHLIGCNRRIKTPDLSCFKPVSMAPTFSVDISVSCHTIRRTRNQVRYPISLKVNFRVTGLSALIMPRLTALLTFWLWGFRCNRFYRSGGLRLLIARNVLVFTHV